MTYVILGDSFTFPEGDAATNRVYTYAKGFVDNNVKVHVVGFRNDYLANHSGETEGIKYHHPFRQSVRHNSFFVRRWQKIKKYYNTVSILKDIYKQDSIKQITVYSTRLVTHLFSWYLSRRFRSKLIKECSEHPLRLYGKNLLTREFGKLKFKIESWLCDGIICISKFLVEFHRNNEIGEHKLLLVPSTVDLGRFSRTEAKPLSYKYIGYFGALTFRRDNVDMLIKAFAAVSHKHKEFYLVLGGPGTDSDRKQIIALAEELNISGKINLLDYMPREEITKFISGSDILVMVRSRDMESQASFPSKLTEYLATSKPLITVDVGEISNYLKDGVNAFLVNPGNIAELSNKLDYVIANHDYATSLAKEGHKLTETVFNYRHQAGRIISFVDAL
jgi:glycosyltransferase involved in cell wall biosynthesis